MWYVNKRKENALGGSNSIQNCVGGKDKTRENTLKFQQVPTLIENCNEANLQIMFPLVWRCSVMQTKRKILKESRAFSWKKNVALFHFDSKYKSFLQLLLKKGNIRGIHMLNGSLK